ncbi:MAG: acyl-CoA dehydratase activase [bacterium]|nr:acyl-CoA dehydratase activase [bacterium]
MITKNQFFLGFDIGSVSLNTVIIDSHKNIIEEHYLRTKGQPLKTFLNNLKDILSRYSLDSFQKVSITGSGSNLISETIGIFTYNEIVAQVKAVEHFYPHAKAIIEIGGEDSKLILLNNNKNSVFIEDFAMNALCAAGTGSFLDQQATRLKLSIEDEFGNLALKSKKPPRIAGRCSVFAKTDMIHLQQEATPDYDIVAGLCFALVRNFKSTLVKGKKLHKPIIFQGGVAANKGIIRAIREVFELSDQELIIPKHFTSMGAIGSVLLSLEDQTSTPNLDLNLLKEKISFAKDNSKRLEPLTFNPKNFQVSFSDSSCSLKKEVPSKETLDIYIGIDIGSISTNVVAIDNNKKVIAKQYLMTEGRPIEAVRKGLENIYQEVGKKVNVLGVGTTGSGRYMIGELVGTDIVKNEITAQAVASIEINKDVDTIFEIGGQDSKYISIKNGAIVDFEMNKVCAAGTGSFLEEQAEKLNINIKEEFGNLALSSKSPVSLGERCTVFMESDLVHHQQKASSKDDLVAGLSYSIAFNYLNRVVADHKIGNNIFFQGGVAANKGVIAAFEKITNKKITVPEHHEVTGAIGVALIARSFMKQNNQKSKFKGFDFSKRKYIIDSFECHSCSNICEIRKVSFENESPLFFGSRCEKYDLSKKKEDLSLPDLFKERESLLHKDYSSAKIQPNAPIIGIPHILFFYELFPLWNTFFKELGFKVVVSDNTNKNLIHKGIEYVTAETCFPIKLVHGHILNLIDKKVDFIFLPSIINMMSNKNDGEKNQNCPYIQAIPYLINSAFDLNNYKIKLLSPVIRLQKGIKTIENALVEMGKELKKSSWQIKDAIKVAEAAQDLFYSTIKSRGEEIINNLPKDNPSIVIVSRPYNGCDSGINLDLPKKLNQLGILAIPMDYLNLESINISKLCPDMYWKGGQRILGASKIILEKKNLYAIYITNFGCGPDSFIIRYFKENMQKKPYLQIEIDEHSADAGAITRCEAFLDSLKNAPKTFSFENNLSIISKNITINHHRIQDKTIYVPYMGDQSLGIVAGLIAAGLNARLFPESDQKTLEWGRKYTSGKECYPCIITTGDMVKLIKSKDFNPENTAFFMPAGNGPCRFGQYNNLQKLILKDLGLSDIPIINPNQDTNFFKELGSLGDKFFRVAWQGIIAFDHLDQLLRESRPYEIEKGTTDKIYQDCVQKVFNSLNNNGNIYETMGYVGKLFNEIPKKHEKRPVIGMVGEVFVRHNPFSNNNIVRQVEELGGEVWLTSISEWFYYLNFTRKRRELNDKNYISFFTSLKNEFFQNFIEHRIKKLLKGCIRNYDDSCVKDIVELGSSYIHSSFEGEAILSIGKSRDFFYKGLSGIINTMPFTCMPSTIVNAIFKKFREDHSNIPCLTVAYDGQAESNTLVRLEAFLHQAKQYKLQNNNINVNNYY